MKKIVVLFSFLFITSLANAQRQTLLIKNSSAAFPNIEVQVTGDNLATYPPCGGSASILPTMIPNAYYWNVTAPGSFTDFDLPPAPPPNAVTYLDFYLIIGGLPVSTSGRFPLCGIVTGTYTLPFGSYGTFTFTVNVSPTNYIIEIL